MKFLRNKINIVISLLIVIMIVLILFSSNRGYKSKIEGIVGEGLNPVQKVIYNVTKFVSDIYNGIVNYSELVDRVENLSEENGKLRTQVNYYEQLIEENKRLRSIVNLKDRLEDYNFVGVNVIGRNSSYINEYIIDSGSNNGIKKGMVVVSNGGLFGMVTSVSDGWSLVSPLTNGSILVSGVVQRTNGSNGIVSGYKNSDSEYIFKMEYLPIDEDVVEGDVIITSGLGGVYPYNIIIGEVLSIENDQRNMSKSVFIKSYVDFDFARELFVILPKNEYSVEY